MTAYSSGSVQVKVGAAGVRGSGTSFSTYIEAGDYFRVIGDSGFYDVGSINSATRLTLTSRYANSDYHTTRSGHEATTNNATKVYAGTFSNTPVIQEFVVMEASNVRFTDDGAGVLTGAPNGSGTIDYDTGAWTLLFNSTYSSSVDITASYYSGDTLNGMSYQIISDFTSHFSLPEMSINDINYQDIYTRAVRLIDTALYDLDSNTIHASTITASDLTATKARFERYIQLGEHQYIFFGAYDTQASIESAASDIDTTNGGSMYLSTGGNLWYFTSNNTAASLAFT